MIEYPRIISAIAQSQSLSGITKGQDNPISSEAMFYQT